MRECGTCSACCHVAVVPDLKTGWTDCIHQREDVNGSCAVYGAPERPDLCSSFACSWLRGFGHDDDRPDRSGALLTVNETAPGMIIGFLGELEPGAALGRARHIAVAFAEHNDVPLIVVEHGRDDAGRWVVVRDDLRDRAAQIIGQEYARLSPDVAMYERRRPGDGLYR